MDAISRYNLIQSFKQSRSAELDGVNYANVVATYLYDMSLKGWLKKLVFAFFFRTKIVAEKTTGRDLLVFYSCREKNRADYDFIASRLREVAGPDGDYAESVERFQLRQLLSTLRWLPTAFRASRGYHASLLHRLGAALLIAKYRSSAQRLAAALLKQRRILVTFCDAYPVENLLAQLAINLGIDTVTAQHGQYRLLDSRNMSPDAEAYANFISRRMLCWGEATRAEFVRFGLDPQRFVVVGWIRRWRETLNVAAREKSGVLGVMLNGENGKGSNALLIEMAGRVAERLQMKYMVRMHPLNNPEEYRRLIDSRCIALGCFETESYLSRVDFSIAHMSGAVIEMLHARSPVYLLDDGRLADVFRVPGLSYCGANEMVSEILMDMDAPEACAERQARLYRWYNDDSDQVNGIGMAILSDRD